ncbi:MAG: HD domain-containing protein [Ruminococcaceae bacterium]|nr:HD domain-containing protein [Oscillospiraceae bacterium]
MAMENSTFIIEDSDINLLKELVRPYLTDKRYKHTLAVADEVVRLGVIYMPDRVKELTVAALLHDITKRADLEKQLHYCEIFGIINIAHQNISPEVLHSKTGAALAARDFKKFANEDILDAIRYHTTGRDGMTVFETLVYLADYIEPTRTHASCISTRNKFYDRLSAGENKMIVLYDTMIEVLGGTIRYLTEKNAFIDADTINAEQYFSCLKLEASELKCEESNE